MYGDAHLWGLGLNIWPPAGHFRRGLVFFAGQAGAGVSSARGVGEFLLVGHPDIPSRNCIGLSPPGGIMSSAGHRVHVRPGTFPLVGLGGGGAFFA